jgi:hypothetical protein
MVPVVNSRVAIAPDPTSPLLVVVQLSSERTLEPVRHDSSFAEKQESHTALLVVVHRERVRIDRSDDRNP